MRYHHLADTSVEVSEICLGTMTFGEQNTEAEGRILMDMAVDYGVNFFDTAEMYPIPPRSATYARTENIIGNWLTKKGNRDRIVLASKVIGQADDWLPHIRGGHTRLNKENIIPGRYVKVCLSAETTLQRPPCKDHLSETTLHRPPCSPGSDSVLAKGL